MFIRPNATRPHPKTIHRDRVIPIQPQLGEILGEYLDGPCPPPGPLLFSKRSADGTTPIGDWRKSLDRVAKVAGFRRGEVRTRRFRVAFATHRLCTLDEHGQPMTAWKLRGEMGHSSEQMFERRYGRYEKHREPRPVLEYRWEHWREQFGHRLIAGLARLLTVDERCALTTLAESETTQLNGLHVKHPCDVSLHHWKRLVQFGFGENYRDRRSRTTDRDSGRVRGAEAVATQLQLIRGGGHDWSAEQILTLVQRATPE